MIGAYLLAGSRRVAPKIKPLSNYQKIVLNRIKACKRDYVSSSN